MNKDKKKRIRNLERWRKMNAIVKRALANVKRKLADLQKLYPAPYEVVDEKTLVVRNVKRCELCGGSVDRYCYTLPDPHFHYSTRYFQCTKCPAMGDRNTAIMTRMDMEYYEEMFKDKDVIELAELIKEEGDNPHPLTVSIMEQLENGVGLSRIGTFGKW